MRIRLLLLSLLLSFCLLKLSAQQTIKHTAYFEKGNSELSLSEKQVQKKIIDSVSNLFETYEIRIKGNADNTGSSSSNYKLSEKRAIAIADFFIATGIASDKVSTAFDGEEVPDGIDVWVVGIRYTASKEIYMGFKEVNTSDRRTTIDFKLVSLEELKVLLEKVNKRG